MASGEAGAQRKWEEIDSEGEWEFNQQNHQYLVFLQTVAKISDSQQDGKIGVFCWCFLRRRFLDSCLFYPSF